ncbi:MAG TPA: hypothetical protein VFY92_11895 [Hyphomicrobiaceae bacterium]|nr:hypothetical protein [Hyphomicrobiaceae bacterium]
MRDLAPQAAGVLAILVAIAHGLIAELQVFPRTHIEPQRARRMLRMVWQASTLDWIAIGFLLISVPALGSEIARRCVIALAVVVYGYAALGNAFASRGRHLGWCLMLGVVALALIGL